MGQCEPSYVPIHVPVMVGEILDFLDQTPKRLAVDGTSGEGGHAIRMAERIGSKGKVLAVERDLKVIPRLEDRLRSCENAIVSPGLFQDLPEILDGQELSAPDFVLLDLGMSSFQLADEQRGFSLQRDEPCDMRMSPERLRSAADLLNELAESEIADLLYQLGGERRSRRIAKELVKEREIRTTRQIVRAVHRAVGGRRGRIHPATRTFQALRIAVNGEMEALEKALAVIPPLLAPGGILAAISYHSLEDARVKGSFAALAEQEYERLTKKPLRPTKQEVSDNRRSRSAKLRVLRRLPVVQGEERGRERE